MPKNIIICCDGTGNQFSKEENSNIVRLYAALDKTRTDQIVYYDPGVGTMSDPSLRAPFSKYLSIGLGLAFGYGFSRNIREAYTYLMNNYEDGDKVFLFGFSRGAYTVRALAGFIYLNGLLAKGCENLIPYSWRLFSKKTKNKKEFNENYGLCVQFRKTYGRAIEIEFMGIWDTVSTIGWISTPQIFPHTKSNPIVKHVRHAVAIDEKRAYYAKNLWSRPVLNTPEKTVKEVWFPGAHSDVGGSYPEEKSGLSKISLQWMIREIRSLYNSSGNEIFFNTEREDRVINATSGKYAKADPLAELHKSLESGWWILEYIPKKIYIEGSDPDNPKYKWIIPGGREREIGPDAVFHESVKIRREGKPDYRPKCVPEILEILEKYLPG